VWGALGDRTRRAIVECLADGPRALGALAAVLPVSRPAVSQHLKVLKDAGLVSERADGTRRIYRLEPAAVAALRDQLDTFWRRALTGYADAVDIAHAAHADVDDVADVADVAVDDAHEVADVDDTTEENR
jgi:DNA-binding transcriptional ArsR family regulator